MPDDRSRFLVITGGPGLLRYAGEAFGDFALEAAWRILRRDGNSGVFLRCPPLGAAPDRERKQTLKEAERTYAAMVEIYTEVGYELVELPRVPVAARFDFILGSGVADRRTLTAATLTAPSSRHRPAAWRR